MVRDDGTNVMTRPVRSWLARSWRALTLALRLGACVGEAPRPRRRIGCFLGEPPVRIRKAEILGAVLSPDPVAKDGGHKLSWHGALLLIIESVVGVARDALP